MIYSESLKKNRDFQRVYRHGTSYADRYLVMYILENNSDKNRLGISVSKKVGNSVVRHRITRLIRESYRLNEKSFFRGYDIVVIARVPVKEKSFHEVEYSLIKLGNRHHVVDMNYDKKIIDQDD